MFINKKKLGDNLLFYLLSIALLFIFIRVLLEKFNISPKIREGLIDPQDICEISKEKRFVAREDNDNGKRTADNIYNPINDSIMEHLDNTVKYKNKNNSKDMKHVSELKKSAYDKIKNIIKKSFKNIEHNCSIKNELYKRRIDELQKMFNIPKFKEKKIELAQKLKKWGNPMVKKIEIVRNNKEQEQATELFSYMFNIGLTDKLNKDVCNMLIEDPDTSRGDLSSKQKMKEFLESSFKNGNYIFDNIKNHEYFEDIEKDYKTHKEKEKLQKKHKK